MAINVEWKRLETRLANKLFMTLSVLDQDSWLGGKTCTIVDLMCAVALLQAVMRDCGNLIMLRPYHLDVGTRRQDHYAVE